MNKMKTVAVINIIMTKLNEIKGTDKQLVFDIDFKTLEICPKNRMIGNFEGFKFVEHKVERFTPNNSVGEVYRKLVELGL